MKRLTGSTLNGWLKKTVEPLRFVLKRLFIIFLHKTIYHHFIQPILRSEPSIHKHMYYATNYTLCIIIIYLQALK